MDRLGRLVAQHVTPLKGPTRDAYRYDNLAPLTPIRPTCSFNLQAIGLIGPGIATLGVEQLSLSLSKRTNGSWVGAARAAITLGDGLPAPRGVSVEGYWQLDGKRLLRTASASTDGSGVATVLSSRFRARSGAR
jgi:hypothetical protein